MSKLKVLFDDEVNDEPSNIKLNSDYAKNYESWRRKEELNKSKARYGDIDIDNYNDNSSSSSSDNDDDLEVAVLDTNFLQTLSCLKSNDPRIYDQNLNFFTNDNNKPSTSKAIKPKDKPMYLRDYERKLIIENGGLVEEIEDENINNDPRANSPTYVEQQKQLKESFKRVLQENDNEEDENWGGIFKKKSKSKEEVQQEEVDYVQWLKGQKQSLQDDKIENDLKPLKDYWDNPNLESEEKFLRDYILNKKFLDDQDSNYIPSYDEIVHDSDEGLSEDGEAIREQEEFETKYNYRYEEPDKEFIKRYPRTMENSMRKKDDRRKQKRAEIRERKELEKLQKKEELQRMKALKRKEIEEKIEKLKEITGNCDVGFNDEDVDGDFDPEEHDKRMQQLFNDEFYGGEEGDQKPEFGDLDEELEIENWDKWNGDKGTLQVDPHCEDDDFNMDCDYDPTIAHQSEMLENSKGKRKKKRKSKFAEVISERKPIFDPNNKSYEQYLDEYYKLDYEDIIGDTPCRFKYRNVVPNDFGLTVEEILAAKDKELNRWCSLKKAVQIRPDHVEKYEVIAYKKKGQNEQLKKKIFSSLYTNENLIEENYNTSSADLNLDDSRVNEKEETSIQDRSKTKLKKKKSSDFNPNESIDGTKEEQTSKRKQSETIPSDINTDLNKSVDNSKLSQDKNRKRKHSEVVENNDETIEKKSKKKKNRLESNKTSINKNQKGSKNKFNKSMKKNSNKLNIGISDERLKAYGINPKKFKNKLKYGEKK